MEKMKAQNSLANSTETRAESLQADEVASEPEIVARASVQDDSPGEDIEMTVENIENLPTTEEKTSIYSTVSNEDAKLVEIDGSEIVDSSPIEDLPLVEEGTIERPVKEEKTSIDSNVSNEDTKSPEILVETNYPEFDEIIVQPEMHSTPNKGTKLTEEMFDMIPAEEGTTSFDLAFDSNVSNEGDIEATSPPISELNDNEPILSLSILERKRYTSKSDDNVDASIESPLSQNTSSNDLVGGKYIEMQPKVVLHRLEQILCKSITPTKQKRNIRDTDWSSDQNENPKAKRTKCDLPKVKPNGTSSVHPEKIVPQIDTQPKLRVESLIVNQVKPVTPVTVEGEKHNEEKAKPTKPKKGMREKPTKKKIAKSAKASTASRSLAIPEKEPEEPLERRALSGYKIPKRQRSDDTNNLRTLDLNKARLADVPFGWVKLF